MVFLAVQGPATTVAMASSSRIGRAAVPVLLLLLLAACASIRVSEAADPRALQGTAEGLLTGGESQPSALLVTAEEYEALRSKHRRSLLQEEVEVDFTRNRGGSARHSAQEEQAAETP